MTRLQALDFEVNLSDLKWALLVILRLSVNWNYQKYQSINMQEDSSALPLYQSFNQFLSNPI